MKFDVDDLKRIQWAIAILVIMTLIGVGSVWSTQQWAISTERDIREATAARNEVKAKLSRAREEEQELREKIGRFQALKTQGFIGPEKRLDWIETVARIKTARRIFKLDYELAPQRPVDAALLPGGAAAGGFEIMASQMRLQLHLLHEGELLGFLAELRKSVEAMIQVRSCVIERLPPSKVDRSTNAQLRADCTLEWITLREGK